MSQVHNDKWIQAWENSDSPRFNLDAPSTRLVKHYSQVLQGCQQGVFIPLCGRSIDVYWLANKGHRVVGCELAEKPIELFKKDYGKKWEKIQKGAYVLHRCLDEDFKVEIWQGDLFELPSEAFANCDGVYDRAALIALPQWLREKYVAKLQKELGQNITYLLLAFESDGDLQKGPPYIVPEKEVKQYWPQMNCIEAYDDTINKDLSKIYSQ